MAVTQAAAFLVAGWMSAICHGPRASLPGLIFFNIEVILVLMSQDFAQMRASVSGRVQGVGFRAWTRTQANSLGLTGWVRNRADGSVEVLCEGRRPLLEQFAALLREGPSLSRVEEVMVTEDEYTAHDLKYLKVSELGSERYI